jgi:hypothetical protein
MQDRGGMLPTICDKHVLMIGYFMTIFVHIYMTVLIKKLKISVQLEAFNKFI